MVIDDPSLLRFVMQRLGEEVDLIIQFTPVMDAGMSQPDFERFVDRRALFKRVERDRAVVVSCMDAMLEEQGSPPRVPDRSPATDLGSYVIKSIAATYSRHPAYSQKWALEAES